MTRTTVLQRQLSSWPPTLFSPNTEITTKTCTSPATWALIDCSHKGAPHILPIRESPVHFCLLSCVSGYILRLKNVLIYSVPLYVHACVLCCAVLSSQAREKSYDGTDLTDHTHAHVSAQKNMYCMQPQPYISENMVSGFHVY